MVRGQPEGCPYSDRMIQIMMNFINANWPAPKNVFAGITTRHGGVSKPPYDTFNLAHYVGDELPAVEENRKILMTTLKLPSEPIWLEQKHTNIVITVDQHSEQNQPVDGSYTNQPNTVCVVLTADCLPVLICNRDGTEVAALHAGWRGVLSNIIAAGIKKFASPKKDLLVWLGPAIGKNVFEVGGEVREQFIHKYRNAADAFKPSKQKDKWLMDIYLLAKHQLLELGVTNIYGGDHCTYCEPQTFFSFRREAQTGRMASLIYFL